MLLGIAPLVAFFLISSAAFGALMLREAIARRAGGGDVQEEGEVVSSQFVGGSDWVVKVYYSKYGYEAQVLYAGEFLERKTGFPTEQAAEAWGLDYARQHGAPA